MNDTESLIRSTVPPVVISQCGNYRYLLSRQWESAPKYVLWLMLNPSTADATKDDATIRRCTGFSKHWGYGGLLVANLYALRTPYPGDLFNAAIDPVGPGTDAYIKYVAARASLIVCAWGQCGPDPGRRWDVLRLLRDVQGEAPRLHYLILNSTGEPGHPLRLKATLKPTVWDPFREARAGGPGYGPCTACRL